MPTRKLNARAEYRLLQNARIAESATLAAKFPKLRSLSVDLTYFDKTGNTRQGGMKYKVNVEHAKSMFYFACMGTDCAGGDFDLTKELAKAVTGKRKLIEGEMRCQGIRHNKERKEDIPCQSLLKYKVEICY
jgi:hypothetical protein